MSYDARTATIIKENRFHAPLREKCADELLLAIRKDQLDAAECRAELHRIGWTDEHIKARIGR
jgi:hypothetical protein